MTVREMVDASRERLGAQQLCTLFAGASRIVVAKGKKVEEHALQDAELEESELAGWVLGPTGNLRAPTLRLGKTWLVGFNEDTYAEHLRPRA